MNYALNKKFVLPLCVGALCLLVMSCTGKRAEVKEVRGTLEEDVTAPVPDMSGLKDGQWATAVVMHGTGVHVEQLFQVGCSGDSAYVAVAVDPYDVQQAFCQRLGYTSDGEKITLYIDQEPVTTVANTVTDMGGFDDDAIWVGEQIRYDLSGKQPRVCITPGVKFVVGLMLHYDDMPTFTATIKINEGKISLQDIKLK